MSEGVIVGGWPYVIAAYAITAIGLTAYFWSLRRRQNQLDKED
jgi:CcmD family protein